MVNMNSISFGSRKFDKANIDETSTEPRKHTVAKIIVGTATLAGVSAGGLALGYKTGVFSKGSTKLFNKIVSIAAGVEDIANPSKLVKMKLKPLKAGYKVLDKMSNAGAYICQFSTEGFNLAKKFAIEKFDFAKKFIKKKTS